MFVPWVRVFIVVFRRCNFGEVQVTGFSATVGERTAGRWNTPCHFSNTCSVWKVRGGGVGRVRVVCDPVPDVSKIDEKDQFRRIRG